MARKKTLNSLLTRLLVETSHQFLHRTVRKILHLPNETNPQRLRKLKTVPNRRNTLRRFRSRRSTSSVKTQGNATEVSL